MTIVSTPWFVVNTRVLRFALSALLFALCISAEAQQQPGKVRRIDYLSALSVSAESSRLDGFRQALRDLEYVEGKNIVIEYRFAEGKFDRLPQLAAELVRLKDDVIVTTGPTSTRAAKEATTTIPIVMAFDNDPCWEQFRRQPCASGWKHYRIVNLLPRDKR